MKGWVGLCFWTSDAGDDENVVPIWSLTRRRSLLLVDAPAQGARMTCIILPQSKHE